jgi:hypothetical protein
MINVLCRKCLVEYEDGYAQTIFTNSENFCEETGEENASDISGNALQFSKLKIIATVDFQFRWFAARSTAVNKMVSSLQKESVSCVLIEPNVWIVQRCYRMAFESSPSKSINCAFYKQFSYTGCLWKGQNMWRMKLENQLEFTELSVLYISNKSKW